MERGTAAIVGLCLLLALWYGIGHLYNRRRGERLFRWLEPGLDVLGGEREAGWIGSPASGARVNVVHAAPPFRRLELTLLLENREVPLLWLSDRLRGKRDRLIIRATLRSPGSGEVEVAPARRRALRRRHEASWTRREGPYNRTIACRGSGAERRAERVATWLETYGAHLQRFSWGKRDPHVQLQVNLARMLTTPSQAFLADLQDVVGTKNINK